MFNKNYDTPDAINISYSQFSKYKFCPWKFYIEKVVNQGIDDKNIHLYFGQAFHETVQKKFLDPNVTLETLKTNFKIVIFFLIHKDKFQITREALDLYCQQAYGIFDTIPFEKIHKEFEVINTEFEFFYEIGSKKVFHGIIDFILKNKKTGRYLLGDWKTSVKDWSNSKIKDEVFTSQLQFYKYFWAKKKDIPLKDIDIEYWVVSREGKNKFTRFLVESTEKNIKTNVNDLKYTMQLIHLDQKFPKVKFKSSHKCNMCIYNGKPEFCNEEAKQELKNPK